MMQSPMALKRTTRIFGFIEAPCDERSAIGRASRAIARGAYEFVLRARRGLRALSLRPGFLRVEQVRAAGRKSLCSDL